MEGGWSDTCHQVAGDHGGERATAQCYHNEGHGEGLRTPWRHADSVRHYRRAGQLRTAAGRRGVEPPADGVHLRQRGWIQT